MVGRFLLVQLLVFVGTTGLQKKVVDPLNPRNSRRSWDWMVQKSGFYPDIYSFLKPMVLNREFL